MTLFPYKVTFWGKAGAGRTSTNKFWKEAIQPIRVLKEENILFMEASVKSYNTALH